MFAFHHCALSVRDLAKSIEFYRCFGFQPVSVWNSPDGCLRIVHLRLEEQGAILELFWYAQNSDTPSEKQTVGNDLERVGVKHLAFKASSLPQAKRLLLDRGLPPGTDIVHGRTGIDYFFVQDPDGLWLEIVEDHRELTVIE